MEYAINSYPTSIFQSRNDNGEEEECDPVVLGSGSERNEFQLAHRQIRSAFSSASSTSTSSTWRYLCSPKFCQGPPFTAESHAPKRILQKIKRLNRQKDVSNVNVHQTIRYSNRIGFIQKPIPSKDSGIIVPDFYDDDVSDYMSHDSSVGIDPNHQWRQPLARPKLLTQTISNLPNPTEEDTAQHLSPASSVEARDIELEIQQDTATNEMEIPDTDEREMDMGIIQLQRNTIEFDDTSFGLPCANSFDDDDDDDSSLSSYHERRRIPVKQSKNQSNNNKKVEISTHTHDRSTKTIISTISNPALSTTPIVRDIPSGPVGGASNLVPPQIAELGWIPKLIIFLSSDKLEIVEAALFELSAMACPQNEGSYNNDDNDGIVIGIAGRDKNSRTIHDQQQNDDADDIVNTIASAFQYGVHASIIGAMNKWYEFPDVQLLGCRTLHGFGAINSNFRTSACALGALEVLLQAIKNFPEDSELQKLCSACLGCYLTDPEHAQYLVVKLNGIRPMLQTMKNYADDVFLQMWCCSAIEYITRQCPDLIPHLAEQGTVNVLLFVTHHYNDSTNPDHCLILHQARESIDRFP